MKTRNLITLISAISVMMVATACSKYPGFKKSENGIFYKFYVENKDSLKPVESNVLTMKIRYRAEIEGKDSVFFNSADMVRPFEINLQKSDFKGDIYEAFSMLHVGDSATFIINAYDFFTKTAKYPQAPANFDSTSMMYFDVKLLKAESVEAKQKAEMIKNEKLKGEEAGKLQAYLTQNNITQAPTSSGIYFIQQVPGSGPVVATSQFVKLNLTVSSIDGKKLFSTLDANKPVTMEFGKPFDTKGLDEAIGMMRKGSKAKVIVPSVMGFGEKGRRNQQTGEFIIPPYTPVVYELEILDIKTKAQQENEQKAEDAKMKKAADEAKAKEPAMIQEYLKANKITAKPTASGLYYIETVKGKGAKPVVGKKVKVSYTGRLLNGKVFDSSFKGGKSTPYEFPLGQGAVIAGWDEAIGMMLVGGKATLIVPSKLGYGERQMGPDITPFSPLVFDVELVSAEK